MSMRRASAVHTQSALSCVTDESKTRADISLHISHMLAVYHRILTLLYIHYLTGNKY